MKAVKYLSVAIVFLLAGALAETAKHPDTAFLAGFLCWPACGLVYRGFGRKPVQPQCRNPA